jgi:hypothetical protein
VFAIGRGDLLLHVDRQPKAFRVVCNKRVHSANILRIVATRHS